MRDDSETCRVTPYLEKKPSSLRYFQEGPAPIDLTKWRLDIRGAVNTPLSLDYDTLTAMPADYHHRRTVCVCLWTIKRHWYGVRLAHVLAAAGVNLEDDGLYLRQLSTGTEKGRYDATIHMRSAIARNAILAWAADDAPLTLETGFPLRLIDFGLFNYKCVKALRDIEVTRENTLGYWEAHSGYDLDGTIQPKKYYAVDLQRKLWFGGTGEIGDEDI